MFPLLTTVDGEIEKAIVPSELLGTGTTFPDTFLRGDGTWQSYTPTIFVDIGGLIYLDTYIGGF